MNKSIILYMKLYIVFLVALALAHLLAFEPLVARKSSFQCNCILCAIEKILIFLICNSMCIFYHIQCDLSQNDIDKIQFFMKN